MVAVHYKKTILGVLVSAAVAALTGCSTLPDNGHAKIVDGFETGGGSGSQYGSTQTQGIGSSGQFSGQSLSGNASGELGQTTGPNGMLTTVHFGFDRYSLDSQAKSVLAPNVTYLLQNPSTTVVVAGYTDPRGSQEYNFHLGQRRANAVQTYLLQQGISQSQLCTVSYGELQPAVSVSDLGGNWQKAYALDRRAVLQYGQTCSASTHSMGSASGAADASM